MSYIYGAPSKARNANVVYIYAPTFGAPYIYEISSLRVKVCHFLKKQKLHWTQHMVTLHRNACHNFAINNKWPRSPPPHR